METPITGDRLTRPAFRSPPPAFVRTATARFAKPSMTVLVEPIEELAAGIEPASPEYETGVLPLNYASMDEAATEQVYPSRSLGPRPTVFLASVTSVRSGSRYAGGGPPKWPRAPRRNLLCLRISDCQTSRPYLSAEPVFGTA